MRIDGIASAAQIDLFRFANLGSLLLALRYYFTHSFRKYLLRIITVMKTRSNSIVLYRQWLQQWHYDTSPWIKRARKKNNKIFLWKSLALSIKLIKLYFKLCVRLFFFLSSPQKIARMVPARPTLSALQFCPIDHVSQLSQFYYLVIKCNVAKLLHGQTVQRTCDREHTKRWASETELTWFFI